MTNAISNNDIYITTNPVRAANTHIIDPYKASAQSKPKYTMMLLISKDDEETLSNIERAMKAAIAKKWQDDAPETIELPLNDGDGVNSSGTRYKAYCHGHYVLNVSSDEAPEVVDSQLRPITDPNELTFKSLYRVSIRAYAYANKEKNAVSFALHNVQKSSKKATAPRRRASDDFSIEE